jgi:hypothetical protein
MPTMAPVERPVGVEMWGADETEEGVRAPVYTVPRGEMGGLEWRDVSVVYLG